MISAVKVLTWEGLMFENFRNEDVITRNERFWAISLEKFPEDLLRVTIRVV